MNGAIKGDDSNINGSCVQANRAGDALNGLLNGLGGDGHQAALLRLQGDIQDKHISRRPSRSRRVILRSFKLSRNEGGHELKGRK